MNPTRTIDCKKKNRPTTTLLKKKIRMELMKKNKNLLIKKNKNGINSDTLLISNFKNIVKRRIRMELIQILY